MLTINPDNFTNNTQRIGHHLFTQGHISPLEALVFYRVMRLAPRVQELRDTGWDISTWVESDPAGLSYTLYRLAEKPCVDVLAKTFKLGA